MFGFRKITNLTDKELIEKYRTNDDKSIVGVLFERYTDFVFFVAMKYLKNKDEASDALMQIFEKLIADLREHKIDNFKPWLHVVTRNHCLLILRSEKYKQKFENEFKKDVNLLMENNDDLCHDNEIQKEEKLNKLEDAVHKLNDEQKQCIELFYLSNKSYIEVAEITGFDIKKVKSFIQNGKRNLKIIMEKEL
jgi:RNA polymerase sigma-70 factor, ECF subfamily